MDLHVAQWIREQDENGAVSLARTLCMAEASLYGLPLNASTFSARVKAADQGIDGRTQFPEVLDTQFPKGARVWQVKSGGTTPSAEDEFDPIKHAALIEAIQAGSDYVLFWANDPTDIVRGNVTKAFTNKVKTIRSDAAAAFLFADEIERLCSRHLAVLTHRGGLPFGGVVGLDVWAPEFRSMEFQADQARLEMIKAIRSHVESRGEPAELHVFGDTGVGKSRLVFEALSTNGIADRVLVAPDPSSWDPGLLSFTASLTESSLVLVVDDCESEDRRSLTRRIGMSSGRVRLITIGSRPSRERPSGDRRRLEVLPLAIAASRNIALSFGLDEQQATVVAGLTEGYPGLAATLAKALAFGEGDSTLLDRIRGDEDIGPVLAALVDEAEVPLLGLLALFERIGFEGDLGPELRLACDVFGVDEAAVRRVADRELQRFVSTAGRYRRVTPRIFAVWLASRFLELRSSTIVDELQQLPEELRERIVEQMREFAGHPVVSATLGALLEQDPFLSGAIAGVDDGAARLIHVAAIVTPLSAMNAIDRLLEGALTEDLYEAVDARRGLVRSLEVLLWFDDLFDRAASAALRLAIAENETWSNNATGAVQGLFRVYLGGTSASYEQRIKWARRELEDRGAEAVSVLVPGLALAFDTHESRMSTDFGGRTAPPEWRPATALEEITARREAWQLLIELSGTQPESLDVIAQALAKGVRGALARGLFQDVLSTLPTVNWTPKGRAQLVEALNHAIAHDDPDPGLAQNLSELAASLVGQDLDDRARYLLAASVWEMTDDTDELVAGRPRVLMQFVDELSRADQNRWIDVAAMSVDGNAETANRMFDELARVQPSLPFLERLEDLDPSPTAALLGYLRGMVAEGGVPPIEVLGRWEKKPTLAPFIVQATHTFAASDELATFAVRAVDSGLCSAEELGRYLYGAWTRPLSPGVVAEVLSRLNSRVHEWLGDNEEARAIQTLERALGIADQWSESNDLPPGDIPIRREMAQLLSVAEGVPSRNSSMLALHVAHIISRLNLESEQRLAMLVRRMKMLTSFPSEYDLNELDALAEVAPTQTTEAILELIRPAAEGTYAPWAFWLEDAKVLSRLQGVVGSQLLIDTIVSASPAETWPNLVDHIAFDGDIPNPILGALLERSESDELRASATFRFANPRSVSWGSESDNLRERRAVATRWLDADPSPAMRLWLESTILSLDQQIERAENQEAEEWWR